MDIRDFVGSVVHHRYVLKRLIGEGGMGAVFEAEHLEVGRKVAVKLVQAAHARDTEFVARLKREARATGMLESENIVQVLDAGEDEQAGLFIVMELLRGENLEQILARDRKLSPEQAVEIALQAARGLACAHEAGIVHRDLKPANLVLCKRADRTPVVKLVDFGIAKLVRDSKDGLTGPSLTRLGGVVGTPQYMSPEQAQGLADVDARTDVYALGVVLFEMLTGISPIPPLPTYEQKIVHIVTKPAPRASTVDPSIDPVLDDLVLELMATKPEDRPQDMTAVIERLSALAAAELPAPRSIDRATPSPAVSRVPSSTKTILGTGMPTQVGVAMDRPAADEELIPAGVPRRTRPHPLLIAGSASMVLAIVALAWSLSRGASAPPAQSGLVSPPASEVPAAVPTTVLSPVLEPPAPAEVAVRPALVGSVIPTATGAAQPPATPRDAGARVPDAGPRVFGGAGMSSEF